MRFSEIQGYEDIKQKLIKTARSGRISHAQLFLGETGTPKLSLAIAYMQYLNCENPTENDSCGECKQCRLYGKLTHPDLHFIFPVVKTSGNSKPVSADFIKQWREFVLSTNFHDYSDWLAMLGTGNLQGTIYSQESQEIVRMVNYQTYEAKYNALIIYMPEKLHITAANKLLKVLEEPPENTIFILVSENEEQILTTIRSRTQLVKIDNPNPDLMIAILKEEFPDVDEQIISDAVLSSENDLSIAKRIVKEYLSDGETRLSKYFNFFTALMRHSYSWEIDKILALSEEFSSFSKEEQKDFLSYVVRQLRQNFVLNSTNNSKIVYLTRKEKDFAGKFSKFIHKNNIQGLETEFSKAIGDIERNGNSKIIFTDLAFKTGKLLHKKI